LSDDQKNETGRANAGWGSGSLRGQLSAPKMARNITPQIEPLVR